MAGWMTVLRGIGKGAKFVYDHPELLEVLAGATGRKQVAAGVTTVVEAAEPVPAPVPVEPAPQPAPAGPVPEVDLRGKWRGTLDRMAIAELGYPLTDEREVYDNAVLLERGDVEGVRRNLKGKH
jgi:hypothetical protein